MQKLRDRKGERFSFWEILGVDPTSGLHGTKGGRYEWTTYYTCRCVCGRIKPVRLDDLRMEKSRSCGCEGRNQQRDFGRLHVLALSETAKAPTGRLAKCRCICGSIIITSLDKLKSGSTKSCGCLGSRAMANGQREAYEKYKNLKWIGEGNA